MKYLIFILLTALFLPVQSQEATDPSMLIKINEILPSSDFEQIRSFILKNGDRKTYCPNYTDNPHYQVKDGDIEVFFNPSVGRKSTPGESDYTIMYIVSDVNQTPFNYYLYLTDGGDVYLYDYNKYLSQETVRQRILEQLDGILTSLKEEIFGQ